MNSLLTPSIIANIEDEEIASILALITIFTIIGLLIQRELTTNLENRFSHALREIVVIGIIPFLVAFLMIFILRVLRSA